MGGKKRLAHFALLWAQLFFSGWHIVGHLAMKNGSNPFVFVLYREFVASLLMFGAVYFIANGINIDTIDKEDYFRFIFLGLCSFTNVVGAMLALDFISPSRFAIFQTTIPCIATCISIFVGLESFTLVKAFGILLAVAGSILVEVMKGGESEEESNILLGTIIVVIQVFAMANLVVFQKAIINKYHPLILTFVYYTIGGVFTLFLTCGFAYSLKPTDWSFNKDLLTWLGLFYASIFATFYPYNAITWAGKQQIDPSINTLYCTFQPVGTVALSYFILGDLITFPELGGACLVIFGLFVTIMGQRVERRNLLRLKNKRSSKDGSVINIWHIFGRNSSTSDLYSLLADPDPDSDSDDSNTVVDSEALGLGYGA